MNDLNEEKNPTKVQAGIYGIFKNGQWLELGYFYGGTLSEWLAWMKNHGIEEITASPSAFLKR